MLLYDGECGFCARSVQFVLDHNTANDIMFAPLQSDIATELCAPHNVDPTDLDTLIFITANGAYRYSDGTIEISKHLGRPWRIGTALRFVPRPIRDAGYRFVATHRQRLAKVGDTCRIPTPEERQRFLA